MLIEDGKGRGYKAAVGPENKLDVCAIVRSIDLYCNQSEGDTYSLLISETPTVSGSCFCYFKNGAEKDLVISSVKISCSVTETIDFILGDAGTAVGGCECVLVNRKAGCGNVADMFCKIGSNITGLGGGSAVESLVVKGGESSKRYMWLSGLVVPKNHTFSLRVGSGASYIKMTVSRS
jgi:hypothetical protein